MLIKLRFGTGVTVSSPEASAYVEASAVYYDEQYQDLIVRLQGGSTDLSTTIPLSMWKSFAEKLEKAIECGKMVDATFLPLFKSVNREYTLLHWKSYNTDGGSDGEQ